MKPITGIVLSTTFALGFALAGGCYSPTPNQTTVKPSVQTANLQSATFYVDGMV